MMLVVVVPMHVHKVACVLSFKGSALLQPMNNAAHQSPVACTVCVQRRPDNAWPVKMLIASSIQLPAAMRVDAMPKMAVVLLPEWPTVGVLRRGYKCLIADGSECPSALEWVGVAGVAIVALLVRMINVEDPNCVRNGDGATLMVACASLEMTCSVSDRMPVEVASRARRWPANVGQKADPFTRGSFIGEWV